MKMANSDSLSIPAPHGFPLQPPKSCTTNQNLACKEDDPLTLSYSQHNQRPNDFVEEQPPRGTSRKRSLPQTSTPPPAQRRRGRPPKSEKRSLPQSDVPATAPTPVQGQRRRGQPPKARDQPHPKTSSLPQSYVPTTAQPPVQGQRRRGRQPKAGSQPRPKTSSLPQSYVPTTAQPPVQGQRRRGRQPKTSSLPQSYVPTTPQPPVQGQRRRGRQPKAGCQPKTSSLPQSYVPTTPQPPVQGQCRRGRQPKAGCQPNTRNSKQDSSLPSGMSEDNILSFISSLEIILDQLQVTNEVDEHASQINTSPAPHHLVVPIKKSISVDGIRPRMVQSSSFHAEDIEETNIDVSLAEAPVPVSYEKTQILSHNHQISEGIDTKFLQYAANAQQNMAGTQTVLNNGEEISRTLNVDKEIVHTLKAINEKHGDIAQNCSLESDYMKTLVLFGICKVVQDLRKKQLKDLDICSLGSYYTIVTDAENMKVNVQWLHNRLNEIRDALHLSDEAKSFIDEKEWRVGIINRKKKELEMLKSELETLKSEVQATEEELAREVVMVEELNKKFDDQMSKISQFKHANLMDGII